MFVRRANQKTTLCVGLSWFEPSFRTYFGFGTGMTVDVRQLSGKLPEYQMSVRAPRSVSRASLGSLKVIENYTIQTAPMTSYYYQCLSPTYYRQINFYLKFLSFC